MSFLIGVAIGVVAGLAVGASAAAAELRRRARLARRSERRALRAERLAELGAMTRGLAHEIKNPLSTIGLNAQLISEVASDASFTDEDDRAVMKRRAGILEREAERLRGILDDFLRYAGEIHLHPERVDLRDVLDELVDFFMPQAQHRGVRLRFEPPSSPVRARVDASLLKQAALNLMLNAVQAMRPDDGRQPGEQPPELIIRLERVESDDKPMAAVHIIDTGPGMDQAMRERIFTPYFTTRAGGSGLGLPTARRIVEEHGGHIRVHSEPGRGTDMTICIPLDTDPADTER